MGQTGRQLSAFQKGKTNNQNRGIDICREISGYIEGIKIGFENFCAPEINILLCKHLIELHDLLTLLIEKEYQSHRDKSQSHELHNIDEFENRFFNFILNISHQFHHPDGIYT